MYPGILRLTDPRFLSEGRHKDFNYFLKTRAGDLSIDENVDKMVELCFAKKNIPGLDSTFWRFENIEVVKDPELKKEISRRIKGSDRSLGAIARILIEETTRFSGCERACVKFPVDVGHIPELLAWFPDCKIMHITRDPRAVAMSKTNDPSGTARSGATASAPFLVDQETKHLVCNRPVPSDGAAASPVSTPQKLQVISLRRFASRTRENPKRALHVHRGRIYAAITSPGGGNSSAPTFESDRQTAEGF